MKPVRVLWFVEHLAREFDVACAVKCLAEDRHPVEVHIRNIYLHAREALAGKAPQIVVHPFLYFAEGALATENYVKAWPRAVHFNLAWEELFYAANARIKGPSDEFARERVLHHAWGAFYHRFLMDHGVPPGNIFQNGNPAYQLYKTPYSRLLPSRAEIAGRHGLDPRKNWVFIPENYRWAFTADEKLERIAASGEHLAQLEEMKEHCIRSLEILMAWCNELARGRETEIILRPRPATNTQHMLGFMESTIGRAESGFHVLKEGTVREWILASDLVMSSFSTSLIEASIAGKPIYMIEPIPLPSGLHSSWYQYVERVKSDAEFERAGRLGRQGDNWRPLSSWAHREMLSNGDPIQGLSDLVGQLASGERPAPRAPRLGPLGGLHRHLESRRARVLGSALQANLDTHERDDFTDQDVESRTTAWREVLLG